MASEFQSLCDCLLDNLKLRCCFVECLMTLPRHHSTVLTFDWRDLSCICTPRERSMSRRPQHYDLSLDISPWPLFNRFEFVGPHVERLISLPNLCRSSVDVRALLPILAVIGYLIVMMTACNSDSNFEMNLRLLVVSRYLVVRVVADVVDLCFGRLLVLSKLYALIDKRCVFDDLLWFWQLTMIIEILHSIPSTWSPEVFWNHVFGILLPLTVNSIKHTNP